MKKMTMWFCTAPDSIGRSMLIPTLFFFFLLQAKTLLGVSAFTSVSPTTCLGITPHWSTMHTCTTTIAPHASVHPSRDRNRKSTMPRRFDMFLESQRPTSILQSSNSNNTSSAVVNDTLDTAKDEAGASSSTTSTTTTTSPPPAIPRPPLSPPAASILTTEYRNIKEQQMRTAARMEFLSSRVSDLQNQLAEKQQELTGNQAAWKVEKAGFMEKIAQLTGIVQQQQEATSNLDDETLYRKEKLENEVQLLQKEIIKFQTALRSAESSNNELRKRMNDVEDAMEFEQMEFDKQKKSLQAIIEDKQDRLEVVQGKFQANQASFTVEKQEMQQQLEIEQQRLLKAQKEWTENQSRYEAQQVEMSKTLAAQKERLQVAQKQIEAQTQDFTEEKKALESQIKADRLKLTELEKTLSKETEAFQKVQADLEKRIALEQTKVDELYKKLETEQELFSREESNLKVAIDLERKRVEQVQADLEQEQSAFGQERQELLQQIQRQRDEMRDSKRSMAKRYETIRFQLTGLWESAKREAREDKQRLTNKYEGQLAAMSRTLGEMETNLKVANQSKDRLQQAVLDMEKERDRAREETKLVETRYLSMIGERNREITYLQSNVSELRQTVQTREAQLAKYEASFREWAKLGFKVTGNKLSSGKKRVTGWFRGGSGGGSDTKGTRRQRRLF